MILWIKKSTWEPWIELKLQWNPFVKLKCDWYIIIWQPCGMDNNKFQLNTMDKTKTLMKTISKIKIKLKIMDNNKFTSKTMDIKQKLRLKNHGQQNKFRNWPKLWTTIVFFMLCTLTTQIYKLGTNFPMYLPFWISKHQVIQITSKSYSNKNMKSYKSWKGFEPQPIRVVPIVAQALPTPKTQ
jgi:hypothetical protein